MNFLKNAHYVVIIFILLCAFNIHFIDREFWFDESFSLVTAQDIQGGKDIDWFKYDVHPPLYYYSLTGWLYLNTGLPDYQWGRWLSVLFMSIGLLLLASLAKSYFGNKIAIFILLIFSTATTYLHYGTEVRSYALLFMLSIAGIYFLNKYFETLKLKYFVIASIIPGLAMYIHYYSAALIFALLFTYVFLHKKYFENVYEWIHANIFLVMMTAVISIFPLFLAYFQKLRGEGMWFEISGIESWPSAITFGMYMTEGIKSSFFVSTVFFIFIFFILYFVYYTLKNEFDPKKLTAIIMLLLPAAALILTPLLAEGFGNLYHHRFFVVVIWFAIFMMIGTIIKKLWNNFYLLSIFMIVFALMNNVMLSAYIDGAHYELERTLNELPCQDSFVVHESPFSALPAIVFDRQRGCESLKHIVSTKLTDKQMATAGFDALNKDQIYRNLTLPLESFYYVEAERTIVEKNNITLITLYEDDGINLTYVVQ